jgi:transcriptional regulator with XRE-family HTH domain
MTVGQKIKQLRTIKGFSQEDMADKLHISWATYSRIERGKVDITLSRLIQIAKVLKVNLSELILHSTKADELDLIKKITDLEAQIKDLQGKLIKCLEKKKG